MNLSLSFNNFQFVANLVSSIPLPTFSPSHYFEGHVRVISSLPFLYVSLKVLKKQTKQKQNKNQMHAVYFFEETRDHIPMESINHIFKITIIS